MKIRIVEFFKIYFHDNSLVDFINKRNIDFDTFWFFKNRDGTRFSNKCEIVFTEFICLVKLLIKLNGFRNKKILALGGHYSILLGTKLLGVLLGKDYHLFIYNFYLHELGKKKFINRIMKFLLNTKYTTLIVQSPDEVIHYTAISKNSVHFIPYCEDPAFRMDCSKAPEGDYIFSGGYTNRDYSLILECARLNPSIKFVLVVSRLNKEFSNKELPKNIILYKEVDFPTFNGLMYKSCGVIIPLKENVGSSGQMLCLGAMKMSKPIIYCNISSINYYFKDKECGIPYSMGEIDSINEAVKKFFSGEYNVKSMGEKAYKHFLESFTLSSRNEKLLDIILQ